MKYWTIQNLEAWEEALNLGYLQGKRKYVWDDFLPSYHWMMKQMSERLNKYNGEYPIWVWPKRPDLRYAGYLEKGIQGVLLQINVSEDEVLLSDFQAWHIVLNNQFLSLTEDEDMQYESGMLKMSLEDSWVRIFDYKALQQFEYWQSSEEDLQGVTGRLDIGRIKLIKLFKSK